MATKINPLDYGYINNVEIKIGIEDVIYMEVTMTLIPESGEELEIVKQALTDSIRNRGDLL